MSSPKIKQKKWYCADDLFLISLEMVEIMERRYGQSYVLKNKATRRGCQNAIFSKRCNGVRKKKPL